MISFSWAFIGALVGLLVVAVFTPPLRAMPSLPTPGTQDVYDTPSGCVRFRTTQVDCIPGATSLNFIASQHK